MNRTLAFDQRGVTMLEVLIAILIISVGLLGTAGLQAVGLRASIAANERTAATLLAYDAADRMRANMAGVALGAYHNYTAAQNANCLTVAGCTPQQLAQHDMWEWNNAVGLALPSGIGIVCRDSSADDGAVRRPRVREWRRLGVRREAFVALTFQRVLELVVR